MQPLYRKHGNKKTTVRTERSFFICFNLSRRLFGCDSARRALAFAGAAIDTRIGTDDIFAVALADSVYGAYARARAARNAFIGNLVCHDIYLRQFIGRLYHISAQIVNTATANYSVRHCEHLIDDK